MTQAGVKDRPLQQVGRWAMALAAAAALVFLAIPRVARGDETVNSCGPYPHEVFRQAAIVGIGTNATCPAPIGGAMSIAAAGNKVNAGTRAYWLATPPGGLLIKDVTIPTYDAIYMNDGNQYGGGFYWSGGGSEVTDGTSDAAFGVDYGGSEGFPASYFGFQLVCGANPCTSGGSSFIVEQVTFDVEESIAPKLTAGGLWGQQGWVSGNWPISVNGDSPSGVCTLSASIDGKQVATQSFPDDTSAWHQCNAIGSGGLNGTVGTNGFSNGRDHQLTIYGVDAAGLNTGNTYVTAINIDNAVPTVSMPGPRTVASTAGTQYVTATANESYSGVYGLACQVDGGPPQSYLGSSAQVPVSGVGEHSIKCVASSNAMNSAGQHDDLSAPETTTLDIGQPTVSGVSFSNIVHGLKCRKVTERVKVAAKWVRVRRHGKLMKVHRGGRTKVVKAVKCQPRIVKRKVTVVVKQTKHGKTIFVKRKKVERVVLPPKAVSSAIKHVAYGKGTTVSGFLGSYNDTALADRNVEILTAPNNGLGQWTQAAVATTNASGVWTATLPPGPSRLVESTYAGDTTTLPSTSNTVKLLVPARIKISITPHRLPWSGTVTIRGHLAGGYIPPDGVALRLLIGLPHRRHPYSPVPFRSNAKGGFAITWSFATGAGVASYPFSIATTGTESDYPFAASTSKRIKITFGLTTPTTKHHKA